MGAHPKLTGLITGVWWWWWWGGRPCSTVRGRLGGDTCQRAVGSGDGPANGWTDGCSDMFQRGGGSVSRGYHYQPGTDNSCQQLEPSGQFFLPTWHRVWTEPISFIWMYCTECEKGFLREELCWLWLLERGFWQIIQIVSRVWSNS